MNDMLEDLRLELIKIKGALDTTIQKYQLNQAGFPYIGISQSAIISGIALIQAIKACEEWSDTFNVPSDFGVTADRISHRNCSTASEE